MITIYASEDCPACRDVDQTLGQLHMAHRVVPPGESFPAHSMRDGGEYYLGHEQMADHLEQLADLQEEWYRYATDTCYSSDEKGKEGGCA